ncbi:Telomerase reverse transcriptase [Coemansia sp. RSA 1365]|nr:Telomerase reverse transcriptase [Coemansia sp. RSA 1365]
MRASSGAGQGASLAGFFPQISALGEYMDALVEGGRSRRDGDTEAYKQFLQTTMVGHCPMEGRVAFCEPSERLTDIVLMVIRRLLKQSTSSASSGSGLMSRFNQNVLTMGYELRRAGGMNCVGSDSNVTNHFVNSSVVEFNSNRWSCLLSRVGTEAMAHLLYRTSIFLPLLNEGYCQISGEPVSSMPMPQSIKIGASDSAFRLQPPTPAGKKRKRVEGESGAGGNHLQDQHRNVRRRVECVARQSADASSLSSTPPLALSSINITRGKMMFDAPKREKKLDWSLNANFPLNRFGTGAELVHSIFGRWQCLLSAPPEKLVTLADRMLRLHQRFNYRHHLFRICPAPWQQQQQHQKTRLHNSPSTMHIKSLSQPGNVGRFDSVLTADVPAEMEITQDAPASSISQDNHRHTGDLPKILEQASTHKSVYLFLQQCIRSVIPHDLIGGRHNHRRLYVALRALVSAGRFEEPSMHETMQRFRLSEASQWLDTRSAKAMDMYANLIHWILAEFVMRLVKKFFYVTESSSSRYQLYYFRNDVWTTTSRDTWRSLKETGMYKPKTLSAAADASAYQTFGYSRMRLLPKEHGFRAVVNMKKSYVMKRRVPRSTGSTSRDFVERQIISTNRRLADVLAALHPWRHSHPGNFGTATFGPNDIYKRLGLFKRELKSKPEFGTQKLYIAKLDISQAYDTIPQAKLLELLRMHLPDEEMVVHRYWTLLPSFSRFRLSFLRHGQFSCSSDDFRKFARRLSATSKGLVIGDQSATVYLHTDKIYSLISEHILQNTVWSDSGLLQQNKGIPQGSVLSSFLCNFFYGQLENEHLAPVVDTQTTLIMRVVDDFLVVSTAKSQVAAVVERMYQGIEEYGCQLNTSKTLANFGLEIRGQHVKQANSRCFPWCGMLIDDHTLDVMADYSRLAPPAQLGSILTINTGKEPGKMLRQKMLSAVHIKILPLFMDCNFNSRETVLLNLYQNFLLCGKKFHLIYQRLHQRTNNPRYCIGIIEDTLALAYILFKSRCNDRTITSRDVKWLGLHAFHTIFKRKQSRYTWALSSIGKALRDPSMTQKHAQVITPNSAQSSRRSTPETLDEHSPQCISSPPQQSHHTRHHSPPTYEPINQPISAPTRHHRRRSSGASVKKMLGGLLHHASNSDHNGSKPHASEAAPGSKNHSDDDRDRNTKHTANNVKHSPNALIDESESKLENSSFLISDESDDENRDSKENSYNNDNTPRPGMRSMSTFTEQYLAAPAPGMWSSERGNQASAAKPAEDEKSRPNVPLEPEEYTGSKMPWVVEQMALGEQSLSSLFSNKSGYTSNFGDSISSNEFGHGNDNTWRMEKRRRRKQAFGVLKSRVGEARVGIQKVVPAPDIEEFRREDGSADYIAFAYNWVKHYADTQLSYKLDFCHSSTDPCKLDRFLITLQRLVEVSAPYQRFVIWLYKLARWDNPKLTAWWCFAYFFLLHHGMLAMCMWMTPVFIVAYHRLRPSQAYHWLGFERPETSVIPSKVVQEAASGTIAKGLIANRMWDIWRATLGAHIHLVLADVTDWLERAKNCATWKRPWASRVVMVVLSCMGVFMYLVPANVFQKLFGICAGVQFFFLAPLQLRHQRYRRMLLIIDIILWHCPNDIELALDTLYHQTPRHAGDGPETEDTMSHPPPPLLERLRRYAQTLVADLIYAYNPLTKERRPPIMILQTASSTALDQMGDDVTDAGDFYSAFVAGKQLGKNILRDTSKVGPGDDQYTGLGADSSVQFPSVMGEREEREWVKKSGLARRVSNASSINSFGAFDRNSFVLPPSIHRNAVQLAQAAVRKDTQNNPPVPETGTGLCGDAPSSVDSDEDSTDSSDTSPHPRRSLVSRAKDISSRILGKKNRHGSAGSSKESLPQGHESQQLPTAIEDERKRRLRFSSNLKHIDLARHTSAVSGLEESSWDALKNTNYGDNNIISPASPDMRDARRSSLDSLILKSPISGSSTKNPKPGNLELMHDANQLQSLRNKDARATKDGIDMNSLYAFRCIHDGKYGTLFVTSDRFVFRRSRIMGGRRSSVASYLLSSVVAVRKTATGLGKSHGIQLLMNTGKSCSFYGLSDRDDVFGFLLLRCGRGHVY